MSIDPHAETPLSQKAAEPAEPPSWAGPVQALQADIAVMKAEMKKIASDFTREVKAFNEKTDLQNVALGRIEGLASKAATSPLWSLAKAAIYIALMGYVASHGASAKVDIPKAQGSEIQK